MKGNSGILKCLIPSFVADFVEVTGWVDDGGSEHINDKKFDSGTPRLNKSLKKSHGFTQLLALFLSTDLISIIFHYSSCHTVF